MLPETGSNKPIEIEKLKIQNRVDKPKQFDQSDELNSYTETSGIISKFEESEHLGSRTTITWKFQVGIGTLR